MFQKNDNKKPKMSYPLGMQNSLSAISSVMEFGAKKYEKDNWRLAEGEDVERYFDAAIRHMSAHASNELIDEDSGNPHIYHALTSLAMYVELKELYSYDTGEEDAKM